MNKLIETRFSTRHVKTGVFDKHENRITFDLLYHSISLEFKTCVILHVTCSERSLTQFLYVRVLHKSII